MSSVQSSWGSAADGLNVAFVPPGGVELIARDVDSGATVASYRYVAIADTYLFLSRLYPRSSDDCLP